VQVCGFGNSTVVASPPVSSEFSNDLRLSSTTGYLNPYTAHRRFLRAGFFIGYASAPFGTANPSSLPSPLKKRGA
jgi:hypothetical protein